MVAYGPPPARNPFAEVGSVAEWADKWQVERVLGHEYADYNGRFHFNLEWEHDDTHARETSWERNASIMQLVVVHEYIFRHNLVSLHDSLARYGHSVTMVMTINYAYHMVHPPSPEVPSPIPAEGLPESLLLPQPSAGPSTGGEPAEAAGVDPPEGLVPPEAPEATPTPPATDGDGTAPGEDAGAGGS